jgi:hypothetical protein
MMSAIFVTACEAPRGRTVLFFALEINSKKNNAVRAGAKIAEER